MELNNMKRNILASILLLSTFFASAQTTTNYWIVFKDKSGTPYSLNAPEAYMSDRAIARRERQHIALNERDLPVNPSYVAAVESLGAIVKNRSKWYNGVTVTLSDESKQAAIAALPYVKSVTRITVKPAPESAKKFELETAVVTTPTSKTAAYNYGPSYNQAHMIGVDCMHEWGYSGQGMVIAELDAGFFNVNILPAFDSLRINNQILGCRDIVTGDTMVFEDYPHGMNVLSCMGGNLPGSLVGTAPKASYWLIRTEDAASESIQEEINWLVGAEFADSVGADIINSSLGYSVFDDSTTDHTYADMDGNTTIITKAADWAAATGIFVVSSAGNSGGPPWYKITAPADADSILTVGAVDASGNITNFSSRGPTADGRIKPNTVAQGGGAVTAANGGGITMNNGTSFSSPITAGAVACLWQANPARTNMEIMLAIHQSSTQYNSPDTVKGYGIPNFCWANYILAGIDEQEAAAENLDVYPNPFNATFEVNFYSLKKQQVTLELFDVSGRTISSQQVSAEMNTGNRFGISGAEGLAAGVYILQVRTKDKVLVKKVVKE
ncbi:MAG: peptidase and in kexin sedolisin [Bacteroidetes bacterium]|nr:peptidase and in kexin sedolisin [Bacteroidota bacterium]